MIYIVSGFQRCGTSMMMRCLEAGGMQPVFSADKNARMDKKYGKETNPDGYYELEISDFYQPGFPAMHENKVLKCLYGGVLYLPPSHEYRVIFMRRPAKDIKRSMLERFGYAHELLDDSKNFQKEMHRICLCLRDRKSVLSVSEVWMREAVDHTQPTFVQIKNDGWPIDVLKASEVPDGSKMRFR